MVKYFSVNWRNPGHWDVWTDKARVFRIRGEDGAVFVYDERTEDADEAKIPFPRISLRFADVGAAMHFIAQQFMLEGDHARG